MDRVLYRRVRPSRLHGGETRGNREDYRERTENDEPTAGETIIFQSIVSGILLVAVLLICLTNSLPANTLRNGLRQALGGAENLSELIADIRYAGEEIFGREQTPVTYENPPFEQSIPEPMEPVILPSFDPTAENEALNPQIPGPSAVPGLWE